MDTLIDTAKHEEKLLSQYQPSHNQHDSFVAIEAGPWEGWQTPLRFVDLIDCAQQRETLCFAWDGKHVPHLGSSIFFIINGERVAEGHVVRVSDKLVTIIIESITVPISGTRLMSGHQDGTV